MANEIPQMSLKQATPIQGSFTPIVYTPQTEDLSLLQKSLAQIEARQTSAYEQQAKFNETAAKLQTLVNSEEKQWVYDYINKQSAGFKNSIESGDYGAALRQAVNAGSNLLSTPEAMGRIKAQEEYKQELKTQQTRRDKGEISQNTYDWWLSNNPYKYEDTYDSEGNIIGGTDYVAASRPVADINWAAQAQVAFKMITPYKKTTSGTTSVTSDKPGDKVGDNVVSSEYGYSTNSGGTHTVEKVTKQQILDNIEDLLSSTPDGYRQAEQAFDVAKYETEKMVKQYEELITKDPTSEQAKNLEQKLEARRKLMYKNGSPIDYKEYYARMVADNAFAEGLAYDWRTDVTQSSSTTSKQSGTIGGGGTRTNGSYFQGATYDFNSGLWYGPNVRQQTDTESAQQGVGGAASGINNRFSKQS
uniref:Uncharacterized protein n=1 Tax=Geladintestivirus 5 TaxID=3233137 RepID=A0AAU8MHS0_9CAUD